MGVINKISRRKIIILVLIIIEVVSISLTTKALTSRSYKLDEVKKIDNKSNMFAMYKKVGNNPYELYEPEDNAFPASYYVLNTSLSGCIDSDGNDLEGVIISYEEGEIAVKTTKSMFCYLYFDFSLTASQLDYDNTIVNKTSCIDAQCAIDELYNNLKFGLSENLVAGLYRYQGPIVDNYICFGTTNKSTCISDTDKYMYRIIGIDSSGKMKLIKKEALNTAYAWHSDQTSNPTWPETSLYTGLNGSYFLTNTSYVPDSSWSNRIATVNWKYGDFTNTSATPAEIASAELGFTNSVSAKIGLLYIHDYAYGLENAYNCTTSGLCEISWINLCQSGNDTVAPVCGYEWTMIHYKRIILYNQSWTLHSYSLMADTRTTDTLLSVRPVFYLTSNQSIASGDGTIENPFMLS